MGAERIILSLARGLNKNKFRIVIVALTDSNKNEIPLIREAKKYNLLTEVIELKGRFNIKSIFALRQIIKRYNIDILNSQEYKSDIIAFLATRFMKIKIISTIHGWTQAGAKVRFYELLDLIIIRFFHKIIAVSNSVKDELLHKKIPIEKIITIYNGIDYSDFKKTTDTSNLKKFLRINDKTRIIGTIGRLSSEKGHKYFIQAAQEVLKYFPDAIFLIMGEGYLRKSLESYIKKLDLDKNVKLLDYRKDIREILSLLEIYVSSSLRESFGLALCEAMASNKAVVATSVGVAPEIIINNETGILVQPKDAQALAGGIIKLLENESLRTKISKSAGTLIRSRFSLDNMIQKYENVYSYIDKGIK